MHGKIGKISSLHDDLQLPLLVNGAGIGEYKNLDFELARPEELSVMTRLSQFGINLNRLKGEGIQPHQIDRQKYRELMVEAIKSRYDFIFGSIFDKFILDGFGEKTAESVRLGEVIEQSDEYKKWGLNIVKKSLSDNSIQTQMVIMLEGADFVTSLTDINKLITHDVKVFGLQYNKDNYLATNVGGLTVFGREVVNYLLMQNKIIDLAHSSKKTRQDIIDIARYLDRGKQIAYTHGSVEEDVAAGFEKSMKTKERLLTKDEVKAIVMMGGMVGLGVTKPFFNDLNALAERIDSIFSIDYGMYHVALGCDFGGVSNNLSIGIESVNDFDKLAEILNRRFLLSDSIIDYIFRKNAINWTRQALALPQGGTNV